MNVKVKVTREGRYGIDTTWYSVWTPDADADEPVRAATVAVVEDGLALVGESGEATVIDDLRGAEKAFVESRIVWPPELVVANR